MDMIPKYNEERRNFYIGVRGIPGSNNNATEWVTEPIECPLSPGTFIYVGNDIPGVRDKIMQAGRGHFLVYPTTTPFGFDHITDICHRFNRFDPIFISLSARPPYATRLIYKLTLETTDGE